MKMENKTLWNSVLTELQLSLSNANFQTWFKGKTEIVRYENGLIEIGCNSSYTKDWLEQRYHGQLKAILDRITETNNTLYFSVSKNIREEVKASKKVLQPTTTLFDSHDLDKIYEKIEASGLNPNYTFGNYIVGSSNQLAYAVGKAIAESPAKGYNPFFVYGGVGLGKTHLMQAVGHEAVTKNPKIKVLYCTSESFTNGMIEAIQNRRTGEFRAKYRNVDILIIDDIQFIAGRESTQEEFFHTFNELYAKGKQIILSSDRPPEAIAKLEERLRSRFEGGMIADIQPPDTDMREAILISKVKRLNLNIPKEVISYLAKMVSSSVRDLEGALVRLVTQAKINNSNLSLELAKSFIEQRKSRNLNGKINPKEVLEKVCSYFNLKQSDIKGTSRLAKIVLPRQITMYLLRKELGMQLEAIAEFLGGRDHTTVMHGVEKINKTVEKDGKLRGLVEDIRAKLYS
jgi:chromosomal replication initiator protein